MATQTLLDAAVVGDEAAIRQALNTEEIDAVDEFGRHALYLASREGHAGAVQLLLERGAAVDQTIHKDPAEYPHSPLTPEQQTWLDNQLNELLQQLGEVDESDPLYRGLLRGLEEEARKISAEGTGGNESDRHYYTPLKAAVANNHGDVVQLLLQAGADVHHQARGNRMLPLQIAVTHSHLGLVNILADAGADVDAASDALAITPLMQAVKNDDLPMIERLCALGAKQDGIDQYRLVLATEREDVATVQNMLAEGASPNDTAPNGVSTFLTACSSGNEEIVAAMLAADAIVTTQAVENTVLHQHFHLSELLLENQVTSVGTKSGDRDSLSIIKERTKKAGRIDLWEQAHALELELGLRKAKAKVKSKAKAKTKAKPKAKKA